MATNPMSAVIQYLHRATRPADDANLADGHLLRRFIEHRDEAAFEVLVRRHGPMVLGVCLRVVRNRQDAEDAFQATFLVLVRKAASIASRELLANWLYGVAYNTARKARAATAKRRLREKQALEMPEPAVAEQDPWGDDLQALLDQELSALPEKYRAPIVLCDLEGKTRKEAAQQLNCPEGSVSSRLSRARAMLAKRLARHCLAVPGGSLAAVLSQKAAPAWVPPSVLSATIKAASLMAAGQAAAAGIVSAKVVALTDGVLKAMLVSKLKAVTAVLLMVGMAAIGGGLLIHPLAAGQQGQAEKLPAEGRKGDAGAPRKGANSIEEERKKFEGTWQLISVEVDGRTLSRREVKNQIIYPMMKAAADNEGSKLPEGLSWFLLDVKGLLVVYDAEGNVKQQTGHGVILREGTSQIDPGKSPKTIDYILKLRGFNHQTRRQSIYEFVNKDTYRVCMKLSDNERPDNFSTKPGSGHILWVFQRLPGSPAGRSGRATAPPRIPNP